MLLDFSIHAHPETTSEQKQKQQNKAKWET